MKVLGLIFQVLCLIISFSFLVLQQSDAEKVLLMLQVPQLNKCRIDKIYQFGDSLYDTGINLSKKIATGPRCSDGLLIIDFKALECGLNPYKDQNANFMHGVNFAVAGATALPAEILTEKNNIVDPVTNSSLYVQLDWMSSHLKTSCSTDCLEYLKNSLFIVGAIGQNDIGFGISQDKPIEDLKSMVPEIVQTISNGVQKIIGFGANRIIIPGNFPIGCFPRFLTKFIMTTDQQLE